MDGLLGRSDYGGVEFIKDAVKATQNPIIMAANDQDADEIKKLSSVCIALVFRPPPPREVEVYLRRIAELEGKQVSDDEIAAAVTVGRRGPETGHQLPAERQHGRLEPGAKDRTARVSQAFEAFFRER